MNYFQGNKDHQQHVSVGAIMKNNDGFIRVHHFPKEISSGFWKSIGVTDFYILMRETVNPSESLESAVVRGLAEEFNAEATIDDYLGSIVSSAPFQKTTLYFLCTYIGEVASTRDKNDTEGQSILEWKTAEELIPIMRAQKERFGRDDIDESSILERYIAQR
jgi:hypothetical protein